MKETTAIKIAVRDLVNHVLRSGDLVLAFTGGVRPLDGIRGHQKVQRDRPERYTPEVAVSLELERDGIFLEIGGRIDGIFQDDDEPIIEEIKTTSRPLAHHRNHEDPIHWGQLKVYAYLYGRHHQLSTVRVRLTYFQLESERLLELDRTYPLTTLEAYFEKLLGIYLAWGKRVSQWETLRNQSCQEAAFPYPKFRPGQRLMAVEAFRTIRNGGQALVQAATGIGKTMAAIFPAVKALGESRMGKIFYLTARTTGRMAAEDAFALLARKGLRFKSITLTAKDKICMHPEAACIPEECPLAEGYFDRIDDALQAVFERDLFTRPDIETIAQDHRVCPFELSLELSLWCDAIICDYNYAFDPRVYLRRFFAGKERDHIFLIDEAHNLVDRSRRMYSARIAKQAFLDLRRAVGKSHAALYKSMGKINHWLLQKRKDFEDRKGFRAVQEAPRNLYTLLRAFGKIADKWLSLNQKSAFREDLLEIYFQVMAMLRIAEIYDEGFCTCYERQGQELTATLFCIDPSSPLRTVLKRCRGALFFSATLTPLDYFQQILGCDDKVGRLVIGSPFPPNNLKLFIASRVTTLYRKRQQSLPDVARSIVGLATARVGNYLVFFPSYAYMLQVHARIEKRYPQLRTLQQKKNMTEEEREQFLMHFAADRNDTLVGFAVMGGIFGEGIDLRGERLSGVIIVGVGLPAVSDKRELIRAHFEAQGKRGFDFAYAYPGINRVLQAIGRVIRTETDRGAALLVDERFATRRYRELFPLEWQPVNIADLDQLNSALHRFWGE